MSHIKDKILSIEISVETMLYTAYMNVYHQTGEQSMMIKTENLLICRRAWHHRRNTPSARVPLLTAPSAGSIYLFAQFPTPARVLLSRGLSGGSSKPPTHCSRQAFEATFDKLQLIRTTLISKMIKTL